MYVEPQQRFTLREGSKTIGTGVITHLRPPLSDEEKEKRTLKKLMKVFYFVFFYFDGIILEKILKNKKLRINCS